VEESASSSSTPQGGTPQGTLQSKSKSTPSSEWPDPNEEETDSLITIHQQRTSSVNLGVSLSQNYYLQKLNNTHYICEN